MSYWGRWWRVAFVQAGGEAMSDSDWSNFLNNMPIPAFIHMMLCGPDSEDDEDRGEGET